jgi:ketosteroid isomerase-like protein
MHAFLAALLLTLLPAEPNAPMLRVDWTHAVPADSDLAALRGEYVEAVNLGDVNRASNLYTADALTVLCDGTLVRGANAVGARINERAHRHAAVTLTPRRFSYAQGVASETGSFVETLESPAGSATVEGVYVTIYSRAADGRWRIALEVRTTGRAPALGVW